MVKIFSQYFHNINSGKKGEVIPVTGRGGP
jgi:hypothetical protein